ncbi:site-specific integrase [Enterococcus sp. HY326]|uniref:site-specific integrase n=1 Tax=Enterococcus sp. HY326 TaxID=2971265 RepID=UPI00223FEBD8|nr:site-specific integrase [Enterococcus sp. HY326]
MATFKQYEKKDGKYWMFKAYLGVNPITGQRINVTKRNFSTKKEAQLALSRMQVDFDKNKTLDRDASSMNFEELYHLWFEQHKKGIKETTEQRIRIHFDNHILPVFGNLIISKITPIYCQKALNEWADELSTYKQLRIYTKMVLGYGLLLGALTDNAMERTIIPKRNTNKREIADSYYTKEELKQFFERLAQLNDKRAYTFFRVLAFAGLRKGEAQALLWKDIDFSNKSITINKTLAEMQNGEPLVQDTKTQSSNRVVTIDDRTVEILKDWRNHIIQEKLKLGIRDDNFSETVVFRNSVLYRDRQYLYKNYANDVMARIHRHFPEFKIIKVHDFRKTNASLLFESGATIKDVSQRLGHKSTKVTMDIYIKVTQSKQDETAEKFAQYMAF